MTSITSVPDARIRSAFASILDRLDVRNAVYQYEGGAPNPRTGDRTLKIGGRLTRPQKLRQLEILLGNDGYINGVTWRPVPDENPVIVVRFSLKITWNEGIEVGGGPLNYIVGLRGSSFVPVKFIGRPEVKHATFITEAALIDSVVDMIKSWRQML